MLMTFGVPGKVAGGISRLMTAATNERPASRVAACNIFRNMYKQSHEFARFQVRASDQGRSQGSRAACERPTSGLVKSKTLCQAVIR